MPFSSSARMGAGDIVEVAAGQLALGRFHTTQGLDREPRLLRQRLLAYVEQCPRSRDLPSRNLRHLVHFRFIGPRLCILAQVV